MASTYYAGLVRRLAGRPVKVAVDTSGAALTDAVGAGPALVKPNRDELAQAAGHWLDTRDAVDAARELRRRGAAAVLASPGRRSPARRRQRRPASTRTRHGATQHGRRRRCRAGRLPPRGWHRVGRPHLRRRLESSRHPPARQPAARVGDIDTRAVRLWTDPDLRRALEGHH